MTAEVYKLGSTSPASVLLDALDLFGQKSSKADENLQLIRGQLGEAVDTCIRAAGQEYDIPRQKELLKAASFGKSIVDLYNSDDFVDMCDTLRVLNAVRFYQIGMPISYDQYVQITPEKLISRLVNRHQYMLALRLAEHLLVPTDRIYAHWALQKVKTSADDDHTICMTVVHRFEGRRGGSFEELASTAFDEGRDGLATELLNHEPRAGKQVPLLLKMQQHALALDKAIESGDTSLILYVLLELKKNLPLSQFFRTINHRPIAFAFVESSTTDDDRALLKNLYYQDDRRIEGANVLLVESLEQPDTASKLDKLSATLHLLQDAKDQSLYSKSVEEERKLLALQSAYDADLGTDYTGLSLNKTIFGLLKVGEDKKVQKLTSDFKVPDKSAWWIRLSALIAKRDWSALEELQKVKKSPIGWEVSQ